MSKATEENKKDVKKPKKTSETKAEVTKKLNEKEKKTTKPTSKLEKDIAEIIKAEKEKSDRKKAEKAAAQKVQSEKKAQEKAKKQAEATAKKASQPKLEKKLPQNEEKQVDKKSPKKTAETKAESNIAKVKTDKNSVEVKADKQAEEPWIEKKSASKKSEKKSTSLKADKKTETKSTDKKAKKQTETEKADKKPTAKKSGDKWNIKQIGGMLFAKMLRGGASELHANAEEVNKLNVFPVPDGDTGDNMAMTIESGVASLDNIDTDDLAEVLRVASRGMLLGARGNSGVILSQFFAGMAKGLENVETADAKKLAHALELGVKQAYISVMTPTEGTILTVAREAVEYAVSRVNSKSTVQSLFSDLVMEMNASLGRTPEILPVLGEAGVVDSGGAGLLYIIDGLNRVLNGEDVEDADNSYLPKPKAASMDDTSFGPDSEMDFGYCTELLVQLMNKKLKENPFDLEALKLHLSTLGDSIVAFQTESIVKIHVHTLRPDKVLRYMRKFGEFISVKIENMSIQHTELKNGEESEKKDDPTPKKKYGIVAVSNGAGISNLFCELGVDEIVEGGQTNNPSTNDFLDSFAKINADNIFVFPNNSNIIMAATQAAEIYENAKIYVLPTKSIGAGYVAISSMNFDLSEPEDLIAEAEDAIGRITSAYISPAVRDADMNGVHITD